MSKIYSNHGDSIVERTPGQEQQVEKEIQYVVKEVVVEKVVEVKVEPKPEPEPTFDLKQYHAMKNKVKKIQRMK